MYRAYFQLGVIHFYKYKLSTNRLSTKINLGDNSKDT